MKMPLKLFYGGRFLRKNFLAFLKVPGAAESMNSLMRGLRQNE